MTCAGSTPMAANVRCRSLRLGTVAPGELQAFAELARPAVGDGTSRFSGRYTAQMSVGDDPLCAGAQFTDIGCLEKFHETRAFLAGSVGKAVLASLHLDKAGP